MSAHSRPVGASGLVAHPPSDVQIWKRNLGEKRRVGAPYSFSVDVQYRNLMERSAASAQATTGWQSVTADAKTMLTILVPEAYSTTAQDHRPYAQDRTEPHTCSASMNAGLEASRRKGVHLPAVIWSTQRLPCYIVAVHLLIAAPSALIATSGRRKEPPKGAHRRADGGAHDRTGPHS